MGWCSLILVSIVLMHHGSLKTTPPDDFTVNLNINDAPNGGPTFGSPRNESEEWKTGKTSSKESPSKEREPQTDKKRKRILGGSQYKPPKPSSPASLDIPDWEHWTCSLKIRKYEKTKDGKYMTKACTGVLITKLHVLTAVHCIADYKNTDPEKAKLLYPLENVHIFFDVENTKDLTGTKFSSAEFFHVNMQAGKIQFDKKYVINDIAVIKLDREVSWEEDRLRPIKIANQPLKRDHAGHIVLPDPYWMAGWGIYSFVPGSKPYPKFLQYINLSQYLKSTPCPTNKFSDFAKKICYERTNHYGTCKGDSGSPGVIKKVDDKGDITWYLQGIHVASSRAPGYEKSDCNETKSIGVDINVVKYRARIKEWVKPYTI